MWTLVLLIRRFFMNNTTSTDLWGEICEDYYNTGKADFVYCNDHGNKDKDNPKSYFETTFSSEEITAMKYAKGHVLDIGCGVGRNMLWLQSNGLMVTGIDISARTVEVAKKRGAIDVRCLSLWNIQELEFKSDTVLLMGNNMGLAGSLNNTERMLRLLYEITSNEAVLIGNIVDPSSSDPRYIEYQNKNESAGRYKGQIRMRLEYKGKTTTWFDLVLFEKDVLINLLNMCGWKIKNIISCGRSYYVIASKNT